MGLPRPAIVLLAVLAACAHARNYEDPAGPRVAGSYAGTSEATVKVVTFNVKFAQHVDRALAVLQDSPDLRGADVIALQEMDGAGTEAIARALSLNFVYYPTAWHPSAG